MSTISKNNASAKQTIKWIITLVVSFAILIGFWNNDGLNQNQVLFFAITVFYILITAFELLPNMVIAILLPFTYLFFNLAPAPKIFSAWTSTLVWMCLLGMISANVLARVGLLSRLVYWCVGKSGYNYKHIVLLFGVAGIALELISPSGGYVVFASLAYSFCKTLNLEGSNTGKGLMLAATMMIGMGFIYTPEAQGLMIAQGQTVDSSLSLDYVQYFIHKAPMLVFYFIPYLLVPVLFKQDVAIDKQIISDEVAKMGKMSRDEKKSIVITLIFIAYILTISIHKQNIVYGFVLFAMLFFMPGINIGRKEDYGKAHYNIVFFIAAFISIGAVAGHLEFNQVVSKLMVPILSISDNNVVIYTLIYIFGFIVNFLMTPLAGLSAFSAPLTQIAVDMNLSSYAVLYSFTAGIFEALLPYEIAKFLVFYSFGIFEIKDFAKLFGIKALLHLIFLPLVMVPYWSLIGLI